MDKMKFETVDGVDRNVAKIAAMFPQVVTETKGEDGKIRRAVKWDVLKELLSGEYVEGGECYDFTWPGKRAAIAEAAKPIRKTLRPCKEESKDWDTTQNLYIEGDNLEVLKLLQESYLGKVKMIYIDPPYNTGNDFIYEDDFKMSSEQWEEESGSIAEDEETGEKNRMFKNTESNGRFHSDWCSMIYSRLILARDLLTEDGVIFISIDDNEQENLRKICDEIFGEDNFITEFIWEKKKKPSFLHRNVGKLSDYIICYAKSAECTEPFSVETTTEGKKYPLNNAGNGRSVLTFPPHSVCFNCPDGEIQPQDMSEGNIITRLLTPLRVCNGENENEFQLDGEWRYSQDRLNEIINNKEKIIISKIPFRPNHVKNGGEIKKMKNLLSPNHYSMETNEDATEQLIALMGTDCFDNPKPVKLIQYFSKGCLYNSKDAIILDFFSGSATTAHAVMKLNAEDGGKRKFIMVQLPEVCAPDSEAAKAGYSNICEIGKERIRRAGEKIKEENPLAAANLDVGFRVFKVADSNMKDVYYSADEYSQDELDGLVSNIKEDRTDLDLLYGCLLDWGVELSLPHTSEKIDGVTVHTVNNGDLVACFDANIPESAIRTIAKRQPLRAVFRDSSFAGAPQKINVEEIFKLLSPATTVKVI